MQLIVGRQLYFLHLELYKIKKYAPTAKSTLADRRLQTLDCTISFSELY